MQDMETKQPSQRQLRVAEQVRRTLANFLITGHINIRGLQPEFIQITGVKIAPDFSYAAIFINGLNHIDMVQQAELLNRHKGLFRWHIGKNVRLRIVPDIVFKLDVSQDIASHIEELLNSPHVRQDLD